MTTDAVEYWRRRAAEAFARACKTHGTDECEMWIERASYCNDMALRAKAQFKPRRMVWRGRAAGATVSKAHVLKLTVVERIK